MDEKLINLLSQLVIPFFSVFALLITTSMNRKTTLLEKVTEERFNAYKDFCGKGSELMVDPLLLKDNAYLTELHCMYINVLVFCDNYNVVNDCISHAESEESEVVNF